MLRKAFRKKHSPDSFFINSHTVNSNQGTELDVMNEAIGPGKLDTSIFDKLTLDPMKVIFSFFDDRELIKRQLINKKSRAISTDILNVRAEEAAKKSREEFKLIFDKYTKNYTLNKPAQTDLLFILQGVAQHADDLANPAINVNMTIQELLFQYTALMLLLLDVILKLTESKTLIFNIFVRNIHLGISKYEFGNLGTEPEFRSYDKSDFINNRKYLKQSYDLSISNLSKNKIDLVKGHLIALKVIRQNIQRMLNNVEDTTQIKNEGSDIKTEIVAAMKICLNKMKKLTKTSCLLIESTQQSITPTAAPR